MKHNPYSLNDIVAARAQRSEAQFGGPATPRGEPIISLDYGLADPALFPRAELLAATADVLDHDADLTLNYGPAYAGLHEQLVTRLRAQGVEADNNLLISYGSGQILALLPNLATLDQEGWVIRVGTFSKIPKTAIHVIPHCIALTA